MTVFKKVTFLAALTISAFELSRVPRRGILSAERCK